MAKRFVREDELTTWLDEAVASNTTYFRIRRKLYGKFVKLLNTAAHHNAVAALLAPPPAVHELATDDILTVRQYLQARNDGLNDSMTLSFLKVLEDWTSMVS